MSWRPHPVLCLFRCEGTPLRRFLSELLVEEGYLCADSLDLDEVEDPGAALDGRALVFVSASSLSERECDLIVGRLRKGGPTVFVKPPADIVDRLGIGVVEPPHRVYGEAPPGYIHVCEHPWTSHHAGRVIQIFAATTIWHFKGGRPFALASSRKDESSTSPAVMEVDCGEGRAVIFWFDPGESLVLGRQGDPRMASTSPWPRPDAGVVKPGTLFLKHLDPDLRDVPQGDVLADLLVGIVRGLTDDVLPIPRVWFAPDDSPAVTLLDGDSDSYDWKSYETLVGPAVENGIPYTLNVTPKHLEVLDREVADAWLAKGNDFQLHYHYPGWTPSVDDIRRCVPEQQAIFEQTFGRRSVCSRAHSVLWPGYTDVAEILAEHGARMETNYFPFRGFQYGYCGSARPARFMALDGRTLNISQQTCVFMDDPMSNDKAGVPARSADEAYEIITRYYDESATRYHGAICTCLHPVREGATTNIHSVQPAMRQAVIDSTKKHGLRALNMRDWSAFHEARRQVAIQWSGEAWRVTATDAAKGLTIHTPSEAGVCRQGLTWESRTCSLASGQTVTVDLAD